MTGFLIAGTSSGVGKTTTTLAIAAALRRRGHTVQLFKGGPDFLDTGHHSLISGRPSRNLDTWMLSHETNAEIFRRASEGADAVIVEGMMGLFDGIRGEDAQGSSAEIASLLGLPVVLVVDAGKSARSIAAVVLGFELFDPRLQLAGVILNRAANERHFHMLEAAIRARCKTPVLGWLPWEPAISIPERHLGLQTAQEWSQEDVERQINGLSMLAEKHLAFDRILALQCDLDLSTPAAKTTVAAGLRVGVAYDAAFTFYYEDNLELLRELGAEIVFFSPLSDAMLPPRLDALYLGGGYPELHAERLSANLTLMRSLRDFAASRRPIYAECGGMIYLTKSLTIADGRRHAMAGVLPSHIEMTAGLRRFGYVTVEFMQDCLLGPAGTVVRGHSFHYSQMTATESLIKTHRVHYSLSGRWEEEGFSTATTNLLASYIHLHFRGHPAVAENFLSIAAARRAAHGENTGSHPIGEAPAKRVS